MEKLGSTDFFCEKYWVWTWNKQEIIGGYNILLKFVFNDNPMQIINATLIGGCGGHKILPRYLLKFMNPYSKVWWPHNSFIYVFLINQILRNNDFSEI